ncbi:HAD family hydrolase [Corynebacterium felinum]|uniref:Hydrolase of the HAD superfamily n=1 Tax=Corynebacterium felinum TaxID=131318 RepID=A0ABU2B688_9CORY|nr:HAD family hydrolase [Corynebacterium felinum]MDF5820544.1 HAD family hydrolase [Corynebacterium felinum]MDR7354123.1 putative hydrolase of the HAD superfamily [Corynebacterium felinum]WJY96295.1 Pyrimidine 5'-nucleotidase YjjG [Corynebacterium felinum]
MYSCDSSLADYSVILFDLDDTLIDHTQAMVTASYQFAHELGIEPDVERWKQLEAKWFREFELGTVSYDGQRVARIREFLHQPDVDPAHALDMYQRYLDLYQESIVAFPDAPGVLERAVASGARVGIFTNGTGALQQAKMSRARLWDDRFLMLAAAELGVAKPQERCYDIVLGVLQCPADQVLVVGDSVPNDVLGPLQAGMNAVHIHRGPESSDLPFEVPGYRRVSTLDMVR